MSEFRTKLADATICSLYCFQDYLDAHADFEFLVSMAKRGKTRVEFSIIHEDDSLQEPEYSQMLESIMEDLRKEGFRVHLWNTDMSISWGDATTGGAATCREYVQRAYLKRFAIELGKLSRNFLLSCARRGNWYYRFEFTDTIDDEYCDAVTKLLEEKASEIQARDGCVCVATPCSLYICWAPEPHDVEQIEQYLTIFEIQDDFRYRWKQGKFQEYGSEFIAYRNGRILAHGYNEMAVYRAAQQSIKGGHFVLVCANGTTKETTGGTDEKAVLDEDP